MSRWKIQGNENEAKRLANSLGMAFGDSGFTIECPISYAKNHLNLVNVRSKDCIHTKKPNLPKNWIYCVESGNQSFVRFYSMLRKLDLNFEKTVVAYLKELDKKGIPLPHFRGLEFIVNRVIGNLKTFRNTVATKKEKLSVLLRNKELFNSFFVNNPDLRTCVSQQTLDWLHISTYFSYSGPQDETYKAKLHFKGGRPQLSDITLETPSLASFNEETLKQFPWKDSFMAKTLVDGRLQISDACLVDEKWNRIYDISSCNTGNIISYAGKGNLEYPGFEEQHSENLLRDISEMEKIAYWFMDNDETPKESAEYSDSE